MSMLLSPSYLLFQLCVTRFDAMPKSKKVKNRNGVTVRVEQKLIVDGVNVSHTLLGAEGPPTKQKSS